MTETNTVSERIRQEYDSTEKEDMKDQKTIFLAELNRLIRSKTSKIFENQELIGDEVVCLFNDRKILNVMVISKTQSGKTGSMCATIKKYIEDPNNLIPIENIYVITGVSSCEWKKQTKERMPKSIQDRVFHRCELPATFADEIKGKKNILIIMDEVQIAAKKGNTIYTAFSNANLLDKTNLYKNDIKILQYSATPDGNICDLLKWGDAAAKILATEGNGYMCSHKLLQNGRVKQYKELCAPKKKKQEEVDDEVDDDEANEVNEEDKENDIIIENIREIKRDVDNYEYPLFHIIRTKTGPIQELTIDNFRDVFSDNDYVFIKYDKDSEINDINKTLGQKPNKHTFIFIKEMMRCSKTLIKTYLGILYERHTQTPDDSVIIQGLLGRNTGYDDNGISIVYTNIESIHKYGKLLESEFQDTSIIWRSKTTKMIQGECSGNNTFNKIEHYIKDEAPSTIGTEVCQESDPLFIAKFDTCKQACEFFKEHLLEYFNEKFPGKKTRGPNIRKDSAKVNGFFLLGNGSADKPRVRDTDETYANRKRWFANKTKKYKLEPCYRDITDHSTLEWWLIYYGPAPPNKYNFVRGSQ